MSTRPNWIDRLIGGTRQQIIELLVREDRTVQELADEIGVSDNAIRGHLAVLERDGLVAQRDLRRDTGGKPAALYTLSTEADELFPKAYAFVLTGLLSVLDEREGSDGVQKTLAEVGARAAVPAEGSAEERVHAAANLLRSLGGTVDVFRDERGWTLRGFSCPLSSVTAGDNRVCGLAEALVARTTGGSVVEVCEHGRRSRCAFDITFPDEGGD